MFEKTPDDYSTTCSTSQTTSFYLSTDASPANNDVTLQYTMPQAEYMYGCSATAIGMLLAYYDLYGYCENGICYNFSKLIEGTITIDSRHNDGNIYDMKNSSVLAQFIASDDYVDRFYQTSASDEKPYTFVNGDPAKGLNTAAWNCLADYLGTGQYWRSNGDLSTTYYTGMSLQELIDSKYTTTINGEKINDEYLDFKYGLSLYVQSRGFVLDAENTKTVSVSDFSFDDLIYEINAGRAVLLSLQSSTGGHMVTAYGYNAATQEVIFDDTYRTDCRMKWNGTFDYSNSTYSLKAVTTVVFDTENCVQGYQPGSWSQEYQEALDYAQKNNVPILVYYGNRNTCGYCAKLEDEVFASQDFRLYAESGSVVMLKNVSIPGLNYSGTPACYLLNSKGEVISQRQGFSGAEAWMGWFSGYVTLGSDSSLIDLTVSDVQISNTTAQDNKFHENETLYLSATISNIGLVASGKKFTVVIKCDDEVIQTVEIPALAAGQNYKLNNVSLGKFLPGIHTWQIILDSTYVVVEKNENNNRLSGEFFIQYSDNYTPLTSNLHLRNSSVSNLIFNSGYNTYVSQGGSLQDSIINSGYLYVCSGGEARKILIGNNARLYVSSAGTVFDLTVSSGAKNNVWISSGGTVSQAQILSGANIYLQGTGRNMLVSNGGSLSVMGSGSAYDVTVKSGGKINVNGYVSNLTLFDYALLVSGAKVENVQVSNGGHLLAYYRDGVAVSKATVHSGGIMQLGYCSLEGNPEAKDVVISSGGSLFLNSNTSLTNLVLHQGGYAYLGGTVSGNLTIAGSANIDSLITIAPTAKISLDVSRKSTSDTTYLVKGMQNLMNYPLSLIVKTNQSAGCYTLGLCTDEFTGSFSICSTDGTCYTTETLSLSKVAEVGKMTLELEQDYTKVNLNVFHSGATIYNNQSINSGTSGSVKYGMTTTSAVVNSGGKLYIGTEGVASKIQVNEAGWLFVNEGGIAKGTTLKGSAYIWVNSQAVQTEYMSYGYQKIAGGTASDTVASNGGSILVSQGGKMYTPHLSSGGNMSISSGGIASNAQIHSGGRVTVSSGGKLIDATIASGGDLNVYSGGQLSGTVNVCNPFYIYSGAVLENVKLNYDLTGVPTDSYLSYNYAGTKDITEINITIAEQFAPGLYNLIYGGGDYSGVQFNFKDKNTTVNTISVGESFEYRGTEYTLVQNSYQIYLSVKNQEISGRSDLKLSRLYSTRQNGFDNLLDTQDTIVHFTINNAGKLAAAATEAVIYVDGQQVKVVSVQTLGVDEACDFSVNLGILTAGYHSICVKADHGAILTEISENNNCKEIKTLVSSGALPAPHGVWLANTSQGTNVQRLNISANSAFVYSNGTVSSAVVNGGNLKISSGGKVNTLSGSGVVSVCFGGEVSSAIISGGSMVISRGGTVSSLTLKDSAYASLGEAYASKLFIYDKTSANISGGSIGDVTISGTSGTSATLYISGNAHLNGVKTSQGAYVCVSKGQIDEFSLNSGGTLSVRKDAEIKHLKISSGGVAGVSSGGKIINLNMSSGGTAYIYSGGNLSGQITLAAGALCSAYKGAEIQLDISKRSTTDAVLINDISLVKGTPVYTVIISAAQSEGAYKLAGNAAAFTGSITVCTSSGICYDPISVGDSFCDTASQYCYTLARENATLSLVVKASAETPVLPGNAVKVFSSSILVSYGTAVSNVTLKTGSTNSMTASSGGYAQNVNVSSGGVVYLHEGGSAEKMQIHSYGMAWVSSGGLLSSATVSAGTVNIFGGSANQLKIASGTVNISSGGILDNSEIANGRINVYSGTLNSGTVLQGGIQDIFRGGVASDSVASSGGKIWLAGGEAYNATVSSGGTLAVRSYGNDLSYASGVQIYNGGFMDVYDSSTAENTVIHQGGYVRIRDYGSAVSTLIESGASMYVHSSSGYAYDTVISGFGRVYDGALMSQTTIASGGSFHLWRGGILKDAQVAYGGLLDIRESAPVLTGEIVVAGQLKASFDQNINAVNADIVLDLSSRTAADDYSIINLDYLGKTNISVEVSDYQAVGTYKLASNAADFTDSIIICTASGICYNPIKVGGSVCDSTGNYCYTLTRQNSNILLSVTAQETPVISNGPVCVYSSSTLVAGGAYLSGITLRSGGKDTMHISSGGIAESTVLSNGGVMYISAGGIAKNTQINTLGTATVLSGGIASDVDMVASSSFIHIKSGGVVSGITLGWRNSMFVSAGASAVNATIDSHARTVVWVNSNSYMNGTVLGKSFEMKDGVLSNFSIYQNGRLYISSGCSALNVTQEWKNSAFISQGAYGSNFILRSETVLHNRGIADDTTVEFAGNYIVSGRAVASGTQVLSGGVMTLHSGAVLKGEQTLGGTVNLQGAVQAENANIVFDLTERNASDSAIIDAQYHLNAVSYSITVSSDQKNGIYKLAEGATDFNGSITVGDGITDYGTLTVNGEKLNYGKQVFHLTTKDSLLQLEISVASTDIPIIPDTCKKNLTETFSNGILVSSALIMTGKTIVGTEENLMHVHGNALATDTTVSYGGIMYVTGALDISDDIFWNALNSGTASNTTVLSGGQLIIDGGGFAQDLIIQSGATLSAEERFFLDFAIPYGDQEYSAIEYFGYGTLKNVQLHSGGTLKLCGKTTLQGMQEYGGTVTVYQPVSAAEANVNFVLTERSVSDAVIVDNLANLAAASYNITISSQQYGTYKLAGGAAGFNSVISIGDGTVHFGELSVNGELLSYNGISYGLLLDQAILYLTVSSPDSPPSSGLVEVYSSGTLVKKGTVLTGETIVSGQNNSMFVYSGGTANSTTVNENGVMYVSSGGVVHDTVLSGTGALIISAGSMVLVGGYAENTQIQYNGRADVSSGMAYRTVVSDGLLEVFEQGRASATQIYDNGVFILSAGASAWDTLVDNAYFTLYDYGVANTTTIKSGGRMIVHYDSIASNTTVQSGGNLTVSGEHGVASATDTVISSGGILDTFYSAYLGNTHIDSGAIMSAGSDVILAGEHIWGGTIILTENVNASMADLTLNLSNRKTDDEIIVNELSFLSTDCFTVKVSDSQAFGTYKLAASATAFTGNITVCTTAGICYDPIKVGGAFCDDATGYCYSLQQENTTLLLKISENKVIQTPLTLTITGNAENWTNQDVTLSAIATGGNVEYFDGTNWIAGTNITVQQNGTYKFRVVDETGNSLEKSVTVDKIDKSAPETPTQLTGTISGNQVKLSWAQAKDIGLSGVLEYELRYGTEKNLSGAGEKVTTTRQTLTDLDYGLYYYQVRAVDRSGNFSEWSEVQTFEYLPKNPENLQSSPAFLRWSRTANTESYQVEISIDNFSHNICLNTENTEFAMLGLPYGEYQWRVRSKDSFTWSKGDVIKQQENSGEPQILVAQKDNIQDIFFADVSGKWSHGYFAEYQGNATIAETIKLYEKNKIADVFAGSDDANVLVLTDDSNGDALFVDDVFTALGEQARLSQIDEIRAGAGNDIIDLTSHQFAYNGDGVKIYGGLGDDVIWANNGSNILFGDAGNDRIVGGKDNDVIIGGIGNDSLHGGGGEDIFCFGGDWGNDTVEQLANGKVTLWFEDNSGSWDEKTLTYTDGKNSVTVSGVSEVTLKFGTDDTLPAGVFDNFASEKIFEDKDKGLLA